MAIRARSKGEPLHLEGTMRHWRWIPMVAAAAALASANANAARLRCEMDYTMSGWAAFYKTAKGEGVVKCSNGDSMRVKLKSEGGGFTFGKSTIDDGHGVFTGVMEIADVLGSYASGGAGAGAGKSSSAQGLTKGEVSLSLTGKGRGVNVGVDFGKFTITRAE
jgi:hypothetical protein